MNPVSLVPNNSCATVADCFHHGSCASGTCVCEYFWLGPRCQEPFERYDRSAWLGFVACVAAVQCLVILGLALNMHSTLRRCSTSSSSPFTLRDGACVILLCGSFIRCVWLLDPEGTHGLLSPNVALFLLRLPQLLWVSAISVLILTWSYVMSAVCEEQSRHKYSRWTLVAGLVALCCVSAPASIIHAVDGATWAHDVSNFAFIAYALLVLSVGAHTALTFRRVVDVESSSMRIPRPALHRLNSAVSVTLRCMVWSCALSLTLLASTAVTAALGIVPRAHPQLYLGYMFVIHVCVEPGLCAVLLYGTNTVEAREGVSCLLLLPWNWPYCCRVGELEGKGSGGELQDVLLRKQGDALRPRSELAAALRLGRENTDSDFGRTLSICSRDSADSYAHADDDADDLGIQMMGHDDPYGAGTYRY